MCVWQLMTHSIAAADSGRAVRTSSFPPSGGLPTRSWPAEFPPAPTLYASTTLGIWPRSSSIRHWTAPPPASHGELQHEAGVPRRRRLVVVRRPRSHHRHLDLSHGLSHETPRHGPHQAGRCGQPSPRSPTGQGFWGLQHTRRTSSVAFLNRASQVQVLPRAPVNIGF